MQVISTVLLSENNSSNIEDIFQIEGKRLCASCANDTVDDSSEIEEIYQIEGKRTFASCANDTVDEDFGRNEVCSVS